jgi:hypothetical protein
VYVKPAHPSLVIRDPHTLRILPPEGAAVTDTTYWRRRLADGDVVLASEAESSPQKNKGGDK